MEFLANRDGTLKVYGIFSLQKSIEVFILYSVEASKSRYGSTFDMSAMLP